LLDTCNAYVIFSPNFKYIRYENILIYCQIKIEMVFWGVFLEIFAKNLIALKNGRKHMDHATI
jgi:hypothetical protein